jgi:hypothetical protein
MSSPFVRKIDAATRESWPEVKEALEVVDRSLREISGISEQAWPKVESSIANSGLAFRRRRKVCEQTVWTLARLGWLRTGGERDLAVAAINFVLIGDDALDETYTEAEMELVRAVQALPDYPKE